VYMLCIYRPTWSGMLMSIAQFALDSF